MTKPLKSKDTQPSGTQPNEPEHFNLEIESLPDWSQTPTETIKVKIESADGTEAIEVSQEVYESIQETADIQADADLMRQIKNGKKQASQGKTVAWKSLKDKLDL